MVDGEAGCDAGMNAAVQENFSARLLELMNADFHGEVWPEWLLRQRNDAAKRFLSMPFPSRAQESWRYSHVQALSHRSWSMPRAQETSCEVLSDQAALWQNRPGSVVVFVNGRWIPELGKIAFDSSIVCQSLSNHLAQADLQTTETMLEPCRSLDDNAFSQLNQATWRDGLWIQVPANTNHDSIIHVVYLSLAQDSPPAYAVRHHVEIGENAQLQWFEYHIGSDESLACTLASVHLNEGAELTHGCHDGKGGASAHIGLYDIRQEARSRYRYHQVGAGGICTHKRHDITLAGRSAACHINSFSLPVKRESAEEQFCIRHEAEDTVSELFARTIVTDAARNAFCGHVIVTPEGQRSQAHQKHASLLLSPAAESDALPILEIYADDVQCGHGASMGQIDEKAIHYLRCRGINEAMAHAMLAQAFVQELIDDLPAVMQNEAKQLLERQWCSMSDGAKTGGEK